MHQKDGISVVRAFSGEYKKAGKREKIQLLNRLTKITGYSRKHLQEILLNPPQKHRIRRTRISPYQPVAKLIKQLWIISNYSCGTRLGPMIPIYLQSLKIHEHWIVPPMEEKLLLAVSASTVDRLLKHERRRITIKSRSKTKPGTLLKNQIPIRTFSDWKDEEKRPGFLEIDGVHHSGSDPRGDYVYTLDTTDVFTGWNECRGFMGKSERHTVEGLEIIRKRLPFALLGIDFDTGGEFVNWHLVRYSQRNKITYTRAREEKKNDQNYIEQQNFSVVRRFVGYQRLDTYPQLRILNQLYDLLSDYQNFFQPVMRLKEKIRNGTRLTRRYGVPKTAYQRVLECPEISNDIKQKLKDRFQIPSRIPCHAEGGVGMNAAALSSKMLGWSIDIRDTVFTTPNTT